MGTKVQTSNLMKQRLFFKTNNCTAHVVSGVQVGVTPCPQWDPISGTPQSDPSVGPHQAESVWLSYWG